MKRTQKGFTVVELVVSIVIAGIIIPAVAMGLVNLTVINHHARDLTLASAAVQNKAESLRSMGYNSLNPGTQSFTSELSNTIAGPKTASYTITKDSPTTGIKQIDINISYTEYKSTRTLTYRTYISELGVGQ
jgi:prepilin-type N-terminal cleavage/methylation domain-containing protein